MLKLALTVAVVSTVMPWSANGRIFQGSNPCGWQGITLSYCKVG